MLGRPENCDVCGKEFTKIIIDGRTKNGPWAWMCSACHAQIGVGFGVGRGQEFDVKTGKKLRG